MDLIRKNQLKIFVLTMLFLFVSFQALVSLGGFIAFDHLIKTNFSSNSSFGFLSLWGKNLYPITILFLCLVCVLHKRYRLFVGFVIILMLATAIEIISKKWLNQPAGLLGCFYFDCSGSSPSGHTLRATLMVGTLILVNKYFILLTPLIPFTMYGLVVESWHWTSDVVSGLFLGLLGISVLALVKQKKFSP